LELKDIEKYLKKLYIKENMEEINIINTTCKNMVNEPPREFTRITLSYDNGFLTERKFLSFWVDNKIIKEILNPAKNVRKI